MTAIHQFVPTLTPGDAVGRHYLAVQDTLRAAGYRSELYAAEAKHEYARKAHPYLTYAGGEPGEPTFLLYHHSIGTPVADFVWAREEPLILDYHNITPASFFDEWEPFTAALLTKGRNQLRALQERAVLGLADSTFNATELEALRYRQTAVVPILLDLSTFEAGNAAARRRDDATTWLFVGRLAPNKAQHDVVRALAAYRRLHDPHARLVLVGPSSAPAYDAALRDVIDELALGDAVEITGAVDDATLAAHYETADVFVVCSDHEGFCVPLLEAMYHRLPVVAYAAGAVAETLGDAGILLETKDAYTIAAAVHRVMSDKQLQMQLVDAGARRVQAFSIEQSRQLLLDVLRPVAGDPQ